MPILQQGNREEGEFQMKAPRGYKVMEIIVPVSADLGDEFLDGKGLAVIDRAKAEAYRTAYLKLRETASMVIPDLEANVKAIGGCDHRVGICCCGLIANISLLRKSLGLPS